MVDEDDPKEYRWETGYEKTWEAIKEDDDGFLEASVADLLARAKRKRQHSKHKTLNGKSATKLGMMRHLYVIIDCSASMSCPDLKPTRFLCTIKLLQMFIEEYFDQNPISQLGVIIMHNKRAEKVSELAGNANKHLHTLSALHKTTVLIGEPSLQNGLEMALKSLKLLPTHASREVLVVMGSLTTCDPTDINTTISTLKTEGVRCSVIGLAAEVQICRHLATETRGVYNVILDDCHFKELLYQQIEPPAAARTLEANLIKMGFPHQMATLMKGNSTAAAVGAAVAAAAAASSSSSASSSSCAAADEPLTMCMCHVDCVDEQRSRLTTGGYYCPQCSSKYCELPVECRACGLTLVSAPHFARSYHHLFPAPVYTELPYTEAAFASNYCFACQKTFNSATDDKEVYQCVKCANLFCSDCDLFVHETLHTCPGCATNLATFQVYTNKNGGASNNHK